MTHAAAKKVVNALQEAREHAIALQPTLNQVGELCEDASATAPQGVSLLHVKYATLMRYNLHLAKLALVRLRGNEHDVAPLAKKLVEDSVAIAKLRPIETKLQHHIELLLNGPASSARHGKGDGTPDGEMSTLRPNPSAVVVDDDADADGRDGAKTRRGGKGDAGGDAGEDAEGGTGVYRPPRLAEVVYDARGAAGDANREERERIRRRERALSLDGVRDMVAELRGLPDVLGDDGIPTASVGRGAATAGGGTAPSRQVRKMMREDGDRRRYEEENLTRLGVSKKDRKRRRELEAEGMRGGNEVAALGDIADRMLNRGKKRGKSSSSGRASAREERRLMHDKLEEALDKE